MNITPINARACAFKQIIYLAEAKVETDLQKIGEIAKDMQKAETDHTKKIEIKKAALLFSIALLDAKANSARNESDRSCSIAFANDCLQHLQELNQKYPNLSELEVAKRFFEIGQKFNS